MGTRTSAIINKRLDLNQKTVFRMNKGYMRVALRRISEAIVKIIKNFIYMSIILEIVTNPNIRKSNVMVTTGRRLASTASSCNNL